MPVVWAHTPYSMLSLGIALLPFYGLSTLSLLQLGAERQSREWPTVLCYVFAAVIAVFMDGYTFVMFAAGAGISLAYAVYAYPERRTVLLRIAAPTYALSFALAYFLYSAYTGRGGYEGNSIDFFRGWGVDLSYFVIPTRGMLWVADKLGASIDRTDELHFGDASVWETTFLLPILLLGVIAWHRTRRNKAAIAMLLVAVFGFYMSLGPSLKIDSLKPEALRMSHPHQQSALMPADLAVMPTGNAWISEKLPGFKEMRASYRWAALGIFAVWLLAMAGGTYGDRRGRMVWGGALLAVVLINVPEGQKLREYVSYRHMFNQIDHDLIEPMGRYVHPGETAAFLPWGNDFMAGYLAARLGFKTFNIGGDKNLAMAASRWPKEMNVVGETLDMDDVFPEAKMLATRTADVVVLPYFDMLWSAHIWPCLSEMSVALSEETLGKVRAIPNFICPDKQREDWRAQLDAIRRIPYLLVEDAGLFATVRLRPEYAGDENRKVLLSTMLKDFKYPINPRADFKEATYLLRRGWYAPEANFVWSTDQATLLLPKPERCMSNQCKAVLQYVVYGASPERPVVVTFANGGRKHVWRQSITATSGDWLETSVPLDGANKWRGIVISVNEATSPQALVGSSDTRVLGIALRQVDLRGE